MNAEIDVFRPIARPPVYGVFRWWPQKGEAWIHPFDIGIVKQLIPSDRVFRRDDSEAEFQTVSYGAISFRIRCSLWHPVEFEGFQIGDCVEVKSDYGKREPFLARIQEMCWNHQSKQIEYFLTRNDRRQNRPYTSSELSPVDPIKHKMRLQPRPDSAFAESRQEATADNQSFLRDTS